jgi:hypothetical protein
MKEKLGLVLLFIFLVGWGQMCFDSCDKSQSNNAKENSKSLPFVKCNCWRKALPFSGFIGKNNPEDRYEIFCDAAIKNNSKNILKNASIRVYILTKSDYELDSAKIRGTEDLYPPGSIIKFNLSSPFSNLSKFHHQRCELLEYEEEGSI